MVVKVVINIIHVTFEELTKLVESAIYIGRTGNPSERKRGHV